MYEYLYLLCCVLFWCSCDTTRGIYTVQLQNYSTHIYISCYCLYDLFTYYFIELFNIVHFVCVIAMTTSTKASPVLRDGIVLVSSAIIVAVISGCIFLILYLAHVSPFYTKTTTPLISSASVFPSSSSSSTSSSYTGTLSSSSSSSSPTAIKRQYIKRDIHICIIVTYVMYILQQSTQTWLNARWVWCYAS